MTDVTVFFRGTDKWRSPDYKHKGPEEEIISNRDVNNLHDLLACILHIRKKAKDENRETVYDNRVLEQFMDEFALMVDEISRKKNITDYISRTMFGIDVPVKYQ